MYKVLSILLLVLVSTLIVGQVNAAITYEDNKAKRQIQNFIANVLEDKHNNASQIIVKKFNSTETFILNREYLKPATPTTPPIPVPIPIEGAIPKVNATTTLRICIVGDIDNNSGLTTQVNLAKKYGCEYFVVPGDFGYDSMSGVKSKVSAVYPADKVIVATGNHDDSSFVKSWMGVSTNYFEKSVSNGKLQFIVADSNTGFGCTTTQFNTQKSQIANSQAWYKVFVLHHPFATVQSDHGPNGQFNCYNAVFQNEVDIVAQAHNHNWQLAMFGNVWYGVFGTGTHDTGSSMYDCDSSTFNSVNMNCITGTNGITFVDFPINQQGNEKIYFVNNADKLVKTFGGN